MEAAISGDERPGERVAPMLLLDGMLSDAADPVGLSSRVAGATVGEGKTI